MTTETAGSVEATPVTKTEPPKIFHGDITDAAVEAALKSLVSGWDGDAGSLGITQPRSDWRRNMYWALVAAQAADAEVVPAPKTWRTKAHRVFMIIVMAFCIGMLTAIGIAIAGIALSMLISAITWGFGFYDETIAVFTRFENETGMDVPDIVGRLAIVGGTLTWVVCSIALQFNKNIKT